MLSYKRKETLSRDDFEIIFKSEEDGTTSITVYLLTTVVNKERFVYEAGCHLLIEDLDVQSIHEVFEAVCQKLEKNHLIQVGR